MCVFWCVLCVFCVCMCVCVSVCVCLSVCVHEHVCVCVCVFVVRVRKVCMYGVSHLLACEVEMALNSWMRALTASLSLWALLLPDGLGLLNVCICLRVCVSSVGELFEFVL